MAENTGYDYGTTDGQEAGSDFKNPEPGDHSARLRDIIHCGVFRETFKGKMKKPCAEVIAIFELMDDEDFEDDGVTRLTMHKPFPVKVGDKTFMTKFRKALAPKGDDKGFDDLIGAPCTVSCIGGKDKNEDGTPKYVNFGGVSGVPAKFATMIEELSDQGVGHVPFDQLNEKAIRILNPFLEVQNILMAGDNYAGSKAEEVIAEIRKEDAEFAKFDKKKEDKQDSKAKPEVKTNLSDDEEY